MYGVTQQSISEFAKRNADDIQAIIESTRTLLGDIALADKAKRIAAYVETAERVDVVLDAEREVDVLRDELEGKKRRATGGVPLAELLRTQQAAYRAIAEELGDLPQRIKIEGGGEPVKHVIEGVDLGDLK